MWLLRRDATARRRLLTVKGGKIPHGIIVRERLRPWEVLQLLLLWNSVRRLLLLVRIVRGL